MSRFATAAGARLSFDPALTEGKTTRGLLGEFTREEGLAALLAVTGVIIWSRKRSAPHSPAKRGPHAGEQRITHSPYRGDSA